MRPGLCGGWSAADGFRTWRFRGCRFAPSIAASLRRLAGLRASPSRWLVSDATRIAATDPSTLVVRLRNPWRRFPYALTAIATAPRFVPGPFHVVSGSRDLILVKGQGLTVSFRRLAGPRAIAAFRRGELDEAGVAPADLGALRADRTLGPALRPRALLGLDLIVFRHVGADLRRAYWETAARGDYEALVAGGEAAGALGVVGTGGVIDPARFRQALRSVRELPRVAVKIAVDRSLREGAEILWAQWRDVGLGPLLVRAGASRPDARFRRVLAAYPQAEAIPAELAPGDPRLLRALALDGQGPSLAALDEFLRRQASVAPIAWVADAHLVSSRLVGWREDVLGDVDYERIGVR